MEVTASVRQEQEQALKPSVSDQFFDMAALMSKRRNNDEDDEAQERVERPSSPSGVMPMKEWEEPAGEFEEQQQLQPEEEDDDDRFAEL